MKSEITIPDLGTYAPGSGLHGMAATSDGRFVSGYDGVVSVTTTADAKVEFVAFERHTIACVRSALGYPAYYPLHPVELRKPVQAVLMDLDGTSVHSEGFWVWIVQQTVAALVARPDFELEEADLPYVAGHSVSEHLEYCVRKYCPGQTVELARETYHRLVHREMAAILGGRGRADAFRPAPGLKAFLLALKTRGIKIGLVTSGLHEKAHPEVTAAFRALDLGDPLAFYDAIITAGYPMRPGSPGTLGELCPKPHPWLYAEMARIGLGLPFEARHSVVGLEDSGAGICAIRLAGFSALGLAGGNIIESGARPLCKAFCADLDEALSYIL